MADYVTELTRKVERERCLLERMSNCSTPANLIELQRMRFLQASEELERVIDIYTANPIVC